MESDNKIVKPGNDKPEEAKAKKTRKPFVWTEARRAAFDKCKKAREAKVKVIRQTSAEAKAASKKELQDASELLKNTKRLKEILDLLEKRTESVPEAPVVQQTPAKKVVAAPKKVAPPPPPPVEEPEEEIEEIEEEEEEEAPPPKNHFRYQSNTRNLGVPRVPTSNQSQQSSSQMNRNPYKPTNSYFDAPPAKKQNGPNLLFL